MHWLSVCESAKIGFLALLSANLGPFRVRITRLYHLRDKVKFFANTSFLLSTTMPSPRGTWMIFYLSVTTKSEGTQMAIRSE